MNILLSSAIIVLLIVNMILIIIKRSQDSGIGIDKRLQDEFRNNRTESAEEFRRLREEISNSQKQANDSVVKTINELGKSQKDDIHAVEGRIKMLTESNLEQINKVRDKVDEQLKSIQESNEKKLEQMRNTVDEKLQSTLEKRLGESFKLVSERLEAVQRGLGDMQSLAAGVGDLKRVLTNVKARGTWGEFQIGDILEQILNTEQYGKNIKPIPGRNEIVEYAIKLPGQGGTDQVWLPIDSKFPQEDYQRLLDAAESADADAVAKSTTALVRAIKLSAKDISSKYIAPPHTTDFALMFLPTEGLYSEVLRQPGMVEQLQQEFRIVVAGPSNLAAILNSLRMGFRTLAIEKRSSEVWTILSAVKTEFGKFGDVLTKVKKQLDTASNTIDQADTRTRAMERKLRDVEALPTEDSTKLLGLDEGKFV